MHVALLLDGGGIPPTGDAATPLAALATAARLLDRLPVPLSVAMGGTALRRTRDADPGLVDAVVPQAEWIRLGWSAPELVSLPDVVVERALVHETEVVEGLGGIPGPMWVRGPWDHRLVPVARAAGVRGLLLEAVTVEDGRPGVVHHLDAVLPACPVWPVPEDPRTALSDTDDADGLVIWRVSDPGTIAGLVDLIREAPGCDLTTPGRFLAAHPVMGRLRVRPPVPNGGPDAELLRRKLVRLATRLPERPGAAALEATLDAAAADGLAAGAAAATLTSAHERLIEARRLVDRDRRRGDDWGRFRRIDWDADGSEEVQLELPDLSMVVDPDAGGTVLVLDDKERPWSAGTVPGAGPGVLARVEGAGPDPSPSPVSLEVRSVEEAKGELVLVLDGTSGGGTLSVTVRAAGRRLRISYRLEGIGPGRLGPELVLALDGARIRADGAAWRDVDGPISLAGHRFRLAAGDRQLLVGSMIPADCFVRPVPGGVVVWPHWATDGTGTFDLDLDLDPPLPQPASAERSDS